MSSAYAPCSEIYGRHLSGGDVFAMNPQKTYLEEEQYAEMIEKIKANL